MRPQCKNCEHSAFTYDFAKPKGHMRDYICGDGDYSGTPVYPFDCCNGYKKRFRRNKQVDFNDLKENGYEQLDTV